jgi:hypothetical protein
MQVFVGTVRDPAGQPVAGARVIFTESPVPMPDLAALTGPDGRFMLSLPVAGHYELAVHADGFVPKTTKCDAGPNALPPVDITLQAS